MHVYQLQSAAPSKELEDISLIERNNMPKERTVSQPILFSLIKDCLSDREGLTARELSEILGENKSDVNSVLYEQSATFTKDKSLRPRWFLVEDILETAIDEPEHTEFVELSEELPFALYPWQSRALKAWQQNDRSGMVEAVTGAGKTRLALAAIHEHLLLNGRVAVIVPTVELQRQWNSQFTEFFPSVRVGLLGNGNNGSLQDCDILITIANSASAKNLRLPKGCIGLLVADECHRLGSEVFKRALKPEFACRLGLSATHERSDGAHTSVLEPYFGPVCFQLDYKTAKAERVIARVEVILRACQFDDEEQMQYDEYTEEIARAKKVLVDKFGVTSEPYQRFMEELANMRVNGTRKMSIAVGRYQSAVTKRRMLVSDSDVKLEALKSLTTHIHNSNGALIFTETISAAEKAADLLNELGIESVAMHSQLKPRERQAVFERFKGGDIKAIVAPHLLDEGVDVPEADLGIILAATRTRRQMVQRMGRVLRLKSDNRMATFIIVYIAGTTEDPDKGAHENFLDEILDIAEKISRA